MVQGSCKPSFRTLLCAKIRNLIESSKYLDKNLLSEPNAQKDSNSYTIFCKKGDTLTQGWHTVLFWKVTVYPSTRATSRKINGSYSEISVPYSQITKGYWRAIWHWLVTLRAERRSAPWCAAESREVSSRQQGAEWRLAGKVLESILPEKSKILLDYSKFLSEYWILVPGWRERVPCKQGESAYVKGSET